MRKKRAPKKPGPAALAGLVTPAPAASSGGADDPVAERMLRALADEDRRLAWWKRATSRFPLDAVLGEVLAEGDPRVAGGDLLAASRRAREIIKERMAADGDPYPGEGPEQG